MQFQSFMFRRMGYFGNQRGIMQRYRREAPQWDAHLQKSRQFVLDVIMGKPYHSAAVLGSGWLLDVPLVELCAYFNDVYLYDMRHPATVRRRARNIGNAHCCVADISGFAAPVYQYVKRFCNRKDRPPISGIQPDAAMDLSGFGFVYSCNILNQLDILLLDYLRRYFELNKDETAAFSRNVQQHHIEQLPAGRSCIIADCEEVCFWPDGREASRKTSVFHPITGQADARRWTWQFDTAMTYYIDRTTSFKVLACQL